MSSTLTEEQKRDRVQQVVGIGFSEEQAVTALQMADYDVNRAADLIVQGVIYENDNEFDLIATAEPEPKIRKPTVFNSRQTKSSTTSSVGSTSSIDGDEVAEYEDSRISSLKEMGFSAQEAIDALIACNDDVNEALSLLLSSK
eukprot:gene8020-5772_t